MRRRSTRERPLLAEVQRRQPGLRTAIEADAAMASAQRHETWPTSGRARKLRQLGHLVVTTDAFGGLLAYRVQAALLRRGHPVLSAMAHRLAIVWAQVSIGDPVLVAPGVPLPHGQVVIDGFTEIGPIPVGEAATIGANALVVGDVPAGVIARGVPARGAYLQEQGLIPS